MPLGAEQVSGCGSVQHALSGLEEVAIVAALAGSIVAVEGPALRAHLSAHSVVEVGERGALLADDSTPLGTKGVGWA